MSIRPCRDDEREEILTIVNAAAEAYRGVIPADCALEMLRGMDQPSGETDDVALVPLATPLVAGPGAIATVIVLTERNEGGAGRGLRPAALRDRGPARGRRRARRRVSDEHSLAGRFTRRR